MKTSDNNNQTIGENIARIRKEKGLKQKDLASLAGISVSYLCDIEKNKTKNPSWEVLAKIAVALNLSSLDQLLPPMGSEKMLAQSKHQGYANTKKQVKSVENKVDNAEKLKQIISDFESWSPEKQEKFISFAEVIKDI